MARALIFDLDGTLIDTVYAHVFAWQRALAEAGLPLEGWRIHRRIGMSGGLFTRAVAREVGRPLSDDEVEQIQARHGELYRESAARAAAAARRGRAAGAPAGRVACHSGSRPRAGDPRSTRSLEALGVGDDVVVVERGDVMRAKPEPDLFLACQERMGVDVARLHRGRRRGLGPAGSAARRAC